MKLFYNFDTKLSSKEYANSIKKYGKEHVLMVKRYKAYFILRGIIPFLGLVLIVFCIFIGLKSLSDSLNLSIIWSILLSFIIMIFVLRFLFNVYISYKYDFTLITKDGILTYKQRGLLKSGFKDLPAKNIKSIQFCRTGILANIFGYGDMEIIADGSILGESGTTMQKGGGEIILKYIYKPNSVRRKILEICLGNNIDKTLI